MNVCDAYQKKKPAMQLLQAGYEGRWNNQRIMSVATTKVHLAVGSRDRVSRVGLQVTLTPHDAFACLLIRSWRRIFVFAPMPASSVMMRRVPAAQTRHR
jgi:hypothetical protein